MEHRKYSRIILPCLWIFSISFFIFVIIHSNVLDVPRVKFANFGLIILNGSNDDEGKELSKFAAHMLGLPWDNFTNSHRSGNFTGIFSFYETVFRHLVPYLVEPPEVPINASCLQPSPPSSSSYNCPPLAKVPKIGILLQFGFHADIFEIYLWELCDIVENVFIIESTKSYFRGLSKPLLWPILREQERFSFCKHKIVHFILDDSDVVEEMKKFQDNTVFTMNYELEVLQERRRWEKFLVWNNSTKAYGEGDLLGFGDSDEIPGRRNVERLKTCGLLVDVVDFGIWLPLSGINTAYASDWPVPGHPYTWGDPTFWKFRAAMNLKKPTFPNRQRGQTGSFILGGAHFSRYGYLPFKIVKMLSVIEQDEKASSNILDLPKRFREKDIHDLERNVGHIDVSQQKTKTFNQWKAENETEFKQIVVFPWFYDCNRDRYPAWEGKHDSRLD